MYLILLWSSQDSANVLCQGPAVNILGFVGHTLSTAPTQLYPCSMKAAVDNMWPMSMVASPEHFAQQVEYKQQCFGFAVAFYGEESLSNDLWC